MGQLVEQEQIEPADVFQLSRDNLIVIVFAKETFAKARPGSNPITTGSVEAVLAKAEGGK